MGVYVCPVCSGKGIVKNDFYDLFADENLPVNKTTECRTCNGSGIIWDNVFGITNHKSNSKHNLNNTESKEAEMTETTDETKNHPSIIKDGILGRVDP